MTQIPLEFAERHLAELLGQASLGEELIITRDDRPIAKLVRFDDTRPLAKRGTARGIILHIADDFDAPLEDFKEYSE
jgi:antitoxin (DNA-binding transcriptional repressor) of toxin-antitoxin stability system